MGPSRSNLGGEPEEVPAHAGILCCHKEGDLSNWEDREPDSLRTFRGALGGRGPQGEAPVLGVRKKNGHDAPYYCSLQI